jgi:rhodanese-related sulfurtransferase
MTESTAAPEIDAAELARRHESGAFVLDVREPDEYEAGHVPGAVLIPLGEVVARQAEIPADQDVYVICQVGSRSARAAAYLNGVGHRTTNVAGGTRGWREAGFDVTEGGNP